MSDHLDGYAVNRKKAREVVRIVTDLPVPLVRDIDAWGVTSGMTSRREATETLLKKGLEAVTHAGG